jgi:hypothetical protein
MTNAFDSIKQGLAEAVAHAKFKGAQACLRQALPTACGRRFKPARTPELDAGIVRRPLWLFSRHTAPLGAR